MKYKILVITPVKHIDNVKSILEKTGDVKYFDDPTANEVKKIIGKYDAVFTNPNKSQVFLGKEIIKKAKKLKLICTASTGTNHIDVSFAKKNNITIISLKDERKIINTISSTAEHAFALTLSSLRNINHSYESVLKNKWDYTKFIGRQMNKLTFGIIGYGRLGSMYARYCQSFGSNIIIYDPYKKVYKKNLIQAKKIDKLLKESDVISVHVHLDKNTNKMIDKSYFDKMKSDILLINTSRGEIIEEYHLVRFLKDNPNAKIATDVITNEINNPFASPLFKYAKKSNQVLITPHIGGMTKEAQEIAYCHAAKKMKIYFS